MSSPRDLSNPDCVKRIKHNHRAGLKHDLGTECTAKYRRVAVNHRCGYISRQTALCRGYPFSILRSFCCVSVGFHAFVFICICYPIRTLATHCSSSVNSISEYPTVVDICIEIPPAHYFHRGPMLPRKVEMVLQGKNVKSFKQSYIRT